MQWMRICYRPWVYIPVTRGCKARESLRLEPVSRGVQHLVLELKHAHSTPKACTLQPVSAVTSGAHKSTLDSCRCIPGCDGDYIEPRLSRFPLLPRRRLCCFEKHARITSYRNLIEYPKEENNQYSNPTYSYNPCFCMALCLLPRRLHAVELVNYQNAGLLIHFLLYCLEQGVHGNPEH
jgi:hypothetical protein